MYDDSVYALFLLSGVLILLYWLVGWRGRGKPLVQLAARACCLALPAVIWASRASTFTLVRYLSILETRSAALILPEGERIPLEEADAALLRNDSIYLPGSPTERANLYHAGEVLCQVELDTGRLPIRMDLVCIREPGTLADQAVSDDYGYLYQGEDACWALVNPSLLARGRPYYMPAPFLAAVSQQAEDYLE